MNPTRQVVRCAFPLLLALSACANSVGQKDGGPDGGALVVIDAGRYLLTVLPAATSTPTCDPHHEQPSQFTETTLDWNISPAGLSDCQAAFATADLDGDGYPDLIFYGGHGCGLTPRESIPTIWDGGPHNLPDGGFIQYVGVWFNRPNPDGGRMFVDGTEESGLLAIPGGPPGQYRSLGGVVIGDVNNDGFPDVVAIVDSDSTVLDGGFDKSFSTDVTEIALNDGTGHFTFAPHSDPSTTMQQSNEAATFSDIDNDGKLDLLLSYWYSVYATTNFGNQPQLYQGNGDGTFTDITKSSGSNGGEGLVCGGDTISNLLKGTSPRPSFSVTACDLNGDGYDDLIVGSYGGQSNMVYQNDGTGHFFRAYQDGGIDADQDFDYFQNAYYLCYCSDPSTKNSKYCADAGRPTIDCPTPVTQNWSPGFEDQPALLGGNNFSIACRDMNGDGLNDVYITTIRHWWAGIGTDASTLLLNQQTTPGGAIQMQRIPNTTSNIVYPHLDPQGWNEGVQHVALADFDNDGRPDVLAGVSDYSYQYGALFAQQPDGTFQEHDDWGFHFPCAGFLSVADLDRDGDLDIIATGSLWRTCASANSAAGGGPGWAALPNPADGGQLDPGFSGYDDYGIHVFSNNASTHSTWLEVRLRGDGSTTNSMGIGARVTVTANGVAQMQEMQSTYGLTTEGNDVGVLFFGLGNCGTVDSIDVRWPNKSLSIDHYVGVPAGNLVELHQGDSTVYGVVLP